MLNILPTYGIQTDSKVCLLLGITKQNSVLKTIVKTKELCKTTLVNQCNNHLNITGQYRIRTPQMVQHLKMPLQKYKTNSDKFKIRTIY